MALISVSSPQSAGLVGVNPYVIFIDTTDTYAVVTTAGYLTKQKQNGFVFSNEQMALVKTSDDGVVWLQVSVTGTPPQIVSLVEPLSPGDVVLPTITNHIIASTNTTGTLANISATAINSGSLQAGLSGTSGSLISFPATAANGSLIVSAVNAGGAFNTTIANGTMGQSTVYTIPDIGATTGDIVVSTAAVRMKSVAAAAAAGGAAAQSFTDTFCTSGSVVIGNWVTQTTPQEVIKIVPGNGSFVVTSTGDVGVGTFSYVILK
jgi:hypothetical protein